MADPNPPNGEVVPAAGAPNEFVDNGGFDALSTPPNPPNGVLAPPNPLDTGAAAGAPKVNAVEAGFGAACAVLGGE